LLLTAAVRTYVNTIDLSHYQVNNKTGNKSLKKSVKRVINYYIKAQDSDKLKDM